jgi:Isochorismatase family
MKHTSAPSPDIHNTALLWIDETINHRVWHGQTPLQALKHNTCVLRQFAAGTGMPIICMRRQSSAESEDLHARVVPTWQSPLFKEACLATQKQHFVIAGATLDTHIVGPAIQALDHGFDVHVIQDACGAEHAIDEALAWRSLNHSGARVNTTRSMVSALVDHWASPVGSVAYAVLM